MASKTLGIVGNALFLLLLLLLLLPLSLTVVEFVGYAAEVNDACAFALSGGMAVFVVGFLLFDNESFENGLAGIRGDVFALVLVEVVLVLLNLIFMEGEVGDVLTFELDLLLLPCVELVST